MRNLFFMLLISICSFCTYLSGQSSEPINWDDKNSRTAIQIRCDMDNISLYLDDNFIGRTPIVEPIDLAPGWHRISFFPNPKTVSKSLVKSHQDVRDIYTQGYQDILVEKEQVTPVIISYRSLSADVQTARYNIYSGRWIGFTLAVFLLGIMTWGFS